MPQNIPLKLKTLTRRRDALTSAAAALTSKQRSLLLELHALHAWCEGLEWLQSQTEDGLPHEAQLQQQLQQVHQQVQQQLQLAASSAGGSPLALEDEPGVHTVSPARDPMAYMRHVFTVPLPADAGSITGVQLASIYKEAVTAASLELHAMECGDLDEQQRQQQRDRLAQLWERFFTAAMGVVRAGRAREVEVCFILDLRTMQPDPQGSEQLVAKRGRIVQRLGLTQQQRDVIAAGMRLCARQLEGIVAERAALQAQQPQGGQAGGLASSSSNSIPTGSSSNSSTSTSTYASALADADQRRASLAAEGERSDRLRLLLHKEILMRMGLGGGWVVGNLTWEQLCRAAALWWPYPARFAMLGKAVAEEGG